MAAKPFSAALAGARKAPAGAAAPTNRVRLSGWNNGEPEAADPASMSAQDYAALQASQRTATPSTEASLSWRPTWDDLTPEQNSQYMQGWGMDKEEADQLTGVTPAEPPAPAQQRAQYSADAQITTKALSQEEYDALTPKQRAAVDFNTSLVSAISADANAVSPVAGSFEQEKYDETMIRLFGETTDTYAPNTAAMLDSLQLKDLEGSIDDYLNLNSAVFNTDLPLLEGAAAPEDELLTDRYERGSKFADSTAALETLLGGAAATTLDEKAFTQAGLTYASEQGHTLDTRSNESFTWAYDFAAKDYPDISAKLDDYFSKYSALLGGDETRNKASEAELSSTLLGNTPTPQDDFATYLQFMSSPEAAGTWTYDDLVSSLNENGYNPDDFFMYAGAQLAKDDPLRATLGLG